MRRGRLLHEFILDRIVIALGHRSWAWLAREADVPRSTLATQKSIPKFSIGTLVAIADALQRPVAYFLPPSHSIADEREDDIVAELEDLIRRARGA